MLGDHPSGGIRRKHAVFQRARRQRNLARRQRNRLGPEVGDADKARAGGRRALVGHHVCDVSAEHLTGKPGKRRRVNRCHQLGAQRERAADAASQLYKMQCNTPNLVSLLLQADSMEDFISSSKYLTVIQDEHTAELQRLSEVEDDLNAKMADLNAKQTEVATEQQKASDALASVQSAAAEVQKKADAENAAEAQAAAEAAQRAAAEQAAREQAAAEQHSAATETAPSEPSGSSQSSSNSSGSNTSNNSGSSSSNQGGSSSGSSSSNSGSSGSSSQGGWLTGKASYYGLGDGLMGSMCADGSPVTETSMGIAMLSVPLGTKVEIRYGGKSVVATVRDRGPYAGGRVIDMQPAVARALGFISVGVDTVSYRILG